MLKFISFGSGSSGNSYLLFTDTDALLIDAGVGIRAMKKYFRDYGISMSLVHNILITHDHADHIKCVGSISHDLNIPVFTTPEVHQGIVRNYCVQRKVSADLVRRVEKGVAYEVGEFKVTPFGVPHDSTDNVGYEIECQGVTFCIVTDAGEITDEIKPHISHADYLVIEANHDEEMLKGGPYPEHLKRRIQSVKGHLSNRNCGIALAENMGENLKHVWLCHLSEENNHPELARKTIESVLRSYGIIAGKDFQLEVLKRKTPTGMFELN